MDDLNDGPGGRRYVTAGSYEPIVIQRGTELVHADWHEQPGGEPSTSNLLEYWRILFRHRFAVAGIFVAAVAIGLVATMLMKPIYTASTTLEIEREAAKVLDVDSITPAEAMTGDEFYQTQYGLLKSEALAARVVDNLGLANDDSFLTAMGSSGVGSGKNAAAVRRKRATAILSHSLSVRPVRGSRLVAVAVDSPNPRLAAKLANAVADAFIQSNLERRYESASYARQFLEDRLKQVKARLEDSERQLVAYASQQQIINVSPLIGTGENTGAEQTASQSLTASDLIAMNNALAAAKGERIRAEQKWREARVGDGSAIPEVLQSPTVQSLRQSKAQLQAQYQDKLRVYKPDYPAMVQLKAQIDEIDRQIQAEINAIRASIRGQYEVAQRQEAALAGQVSGLKSGVMDLRNRSIQYNILQREVDTNRTLYDGLLQRYKEVGVAGGVGANNVSVVDQAIPPDHPSRPKPVLNMAIAALLGLILGVLAAFLLEFLDETIQTPEDIEVRLGIPLLGAIPLPPKGMTVEEALADFRSAFCEAYYSVRTALQFSTSTGVPQLLLITSSGPGEGKSTTARTVAQNFARLNMRVLLVDADLRNPSQHRLMRADKSRGLSNVLTGAAPLSEVVQDGGLPGLHFIACGPLPPNPAELLSGHALHDVFNEAASRYDVVIIDGPPVLGLADAPLLANVASGVLMVVEAGSTRLGQVRSSLQRLAQGGRGKVVGAVLTKFNAKRAAYGYGDYAYQYEYGERPQLAHQA